MELNGISTAEFKEIEKTLGKDRAKIFAMHSYHKPTAEELIKGIEGPSLSEVHDKFRKWLHIEDTKRIDAMLACALTVQLEGTPVWLIFVGSSGDAKSEQLSSLMSDNVEIIKNFTSKTLVSGSPNVNMGEDMILKLNNKILLITDLAQILKMNPTEKGQIWAELRDVYDGHLKKMFGTGVEKDYPNLRVTMMAASTPVIDEQLLIHQDLGTRELLYRTSPIKGYHKLKMKIDINEKLENQMKLELNGIVTGFLKGKEIKSININESVSNKLFEMARALAYMRASAQYDPINGELTDDVSVEVPSRLYKQFIRLYYGLKSLDEAYSDEDALEVIQHIVKSSSIPIRLKVFDLLKKNQGKDHFSTSRAANELSVGKKTAFRQLGALNNMGLIKHQITPQNWGADYDEWWFPQEAEVGVTK